jgi:hypothetical protein
MRYSDQVWEWDGSTWWLRSTSTMMPRRAFHGSFYDPHLGCVVVFGGTDNTGPPFGDTWLYGPTDPADYAPFGSGCSGTAGTPELRARDTSLPWLGKTFDIEVAGLQPGALASLAAGLSQTTWGTVGLPLSLAAWGMPGCSLSVSPDALQPLPSASGTGVTTASIAIPYAPGLLGVELYQQAAVLDPGANQAGVVVSNGAILRIGGL